MNCTATRSDQIKKTVGKEAFVNNQMSQYSSRKINRDNIYANGFKQKFHPNSIIIMTYL